LLNETIDSCKKKDGGCNSYDPLPFTWNTVESENLPKFFRAKEYKEAATTYPNQQDWTPNRLPNKFRYLVHRRLLVLKSPD